MNRSRALSLPTTLNTADLSRLQLEWGKGRAGQGGATQGKASKAGHRRADAGQDRAGQGRAGQSRTSLPLKRYSSYSTSRLVMRYVVRVVRVHGAHVPIGTDHREHAADTSHAAPRHAAPRRAGLGQAGRCTRTLLLGYVPEQTT